MTDPNKPVKVTLTEDRIYRANDTDTVAITVKAGEETEVPYWVALAWKQVKEDPSTSSGAAPVKQDAPKPDVKPAKG